MTAPANSGPANSGSSEPRSDIVGVLLAGGQARRMGGGDKCLRSLGGLTILDHIVARTALQVSHLVLNANGDPDRFARFGLPVASDSIAGHAGPLAGVLAGLDWAADNAPECRWLASFATDAPFVPHDLVARLHAGAVAEEADLACAASAGRRHPVFGLWAVHLRHDLRRAMVEEDIRKVDLWTGRRQCVTVTFEAGEIGTGEIGGDPFFNANRPEDLEQAEAWLAKTAD